MNEHFTEIVTLFIYVLLFKVKGKIGHLVETGHVSTIHTMDVYLVNHFSIVLTRTWAISKSKVFRLALWKCQFTTTYQCGEPIKNGINTLCHICTHE